MNVRWLRWIGILAFLLLVCLGGTAFWGYAQFIRAGPLGQSMVVVVPRGAGVDRIAGLLAEKGVIASALVFRLAARTLAADKPLRAGEYRFPASVSTEGVLAVLQDGVTVVRRLTIAEGLSVAEIMGQLAGTEGLEGAIERTPGEGTLLPETYHFSFGDSRQGLMRRMAGAMDAVLAAIWARRAPNLPFDTAREAVILASIIEKETGRAGERARIAAVFVNRLRRAMRLQSDPTVVYGLTRGKASLGRKLTRRDLAHASPYNTYVTDGLPPAPISNPGRAALEAAVRPAATRDLYFVADGQGGHLFARTLAEHNRNVARWRRLQRRR
jgi:UPF0755 protein